MDQPRVYPCPHIAEDFELSGKMDHPSWESAPWSAEFVDIQGESHTKPWFRTRMKMLWSPTTLYIAAELEEPHVWATLTEHDSIIFHDNDFELFLDPDGDNHLYAELEVNALNTTWDLMLVKPYRNGGPAINNWEWKGVRTAVHIDGSLNDPSDIDKGWTVEMAVPFEALRELSQCAIPPAIGDVWRANFSRVEWKHKVEDGKYVKLPGPEENWVWSPQGVIDMHRPEKWGIIQFTDGKSSLPAPTLHPDEIKLMELYHLQADYKSKHGEYGTAEEVGVSDWDGLSMSGTKHQWIATLGEWRVDHESRLMKGEVKTHRPA